MTKENPTTTNGAESYDLADTLARTIAEADASSSSNDDPQARVDAALACPCVADLRSSTCGKSFDAALTCFMLAEERERGKKCVEEFVSLHQCMVKNASEFEAFANELLEHENVRGPARAKD
jgi:mitochondrial intermembrane space import and assembly protein 40